MLPNGLVELQTARLGREQPAPWQMPVPVMPEPVVPMSAQPQDVFDPLMLAMACASDTEVPARVAVPSVQVPVVAASASNDELNAVEEVIFLAQGIQALPPEGISLKQHLVNIERGLIEQALSRTQGNVSRTAKLLQLQRTTLIEKINKYDLRANG